MKGKTKIKRVLALVLTIAAMAAGQTAWAASTWSVTSSTSGTTTTFTITRSESTSAETVYYRTVSLSALEGQHFTAVSGSLTFTAGQTSKTVTVTERNPDAEVYRYQTGSRRSYRFELLDIDGTVITHRDQTVITTTPFTYSGTNVNNAIPSNSFVFLNGDPANLLGIGKCIDVAYTPPTSEVESSGTYQGYVLIDDSYDYSQRAATVSTNTLINSTGATAACLKTMGYKIYATVCFTMKEKNDGYYYVQIVPGTASASYDGADPDGSVDAPAYSVYKACFELKEGSGVYSGEGKMFFPHRFDYANRAAGGLFGTAQTSSWTEFPLAESKLWQQKFKSGYRDNNTGSVVLDPDVASITTRFDCAGSDNDTWGFKDLYVRMGLVDATAPTVLNNYKVSGGRHQKGNIIYVSVPFSEIITVEGTPTLTTTWGTLSYCAGSGSNVLTFCGQIASDATGTFSVSALSGTVRDLAGNAFSGTVSKNFGISLDATYEWSLSDLTQLAANTYEIATKADLYRLANIVNVSHNECEGITFRQTQDIVCDAGYSPIGYYQDDNDRAYFRGTYDGQGHTVSGITVTRSGNTSADKYIGLFGCIYEGTVQNVVLANSTFTGYERVGGIAGFNSWGTVRNCRVESSVTIKGGYGEGYMFGGVVGYSSGTEALISGCVSAATIDRNGLKCSNCGGIVGYVQSSTLKDCLYIGTSVTGTILVGSIAGKKTGGTISNNYYTAISLGSIGGSSTSSDQDGARRARTVTLGADVALDGTATAYDVSGITAYGSTAIGYGGKIYSGEGQTLTLNYNVPDGFSFEGFSVNGTAIDGNTFTVPAADVTVSANFARLPIGSITYSTTLGAYEINCTQHLRDLAEYVNGEYETQGNGIGEVLVTVKEPHNCAGLTFKMTADIDFAPTSTWDDYGSDEHNYTAIGCLQTIYVNADPMHMDNPFSGTFDGQGHTIGGIRINKGSSSYQGLFGYISGGTVRNVKLSDTRITGRSYTGGIVGHNYGGTIADCEAGHTVAVHNVQQKTAMVGGIVGENLASSSVTGCTSAAVITDDSGKTGCSGFGGVVGMNGDGCTVSDCTAAGVIVPNVANSGAIVGNNSGTLSGNKYHSSLVGSYAFNIGTDTGDVNGTEFTKSFFLYTDRDNSALLAAYAATYSGGKSSTAHSGTPPTVANLSVTLKGYTLHKDGSWNTIALPFDFSNLNYANSPLNGATVKELDTSSTAYDSETGILNVAFKTATNISAGKPYIVKWDSGTDVTDPTFSGISGSHFSTSNPATKDAPIKIQGSSAKPFASTDGLLFDSHNADNQICHAAISLSAPAESPGSTFEGWFTDEQRTVAPTVIPFGTDGSFSLYAKLTKNELTLTEADGVSTLTSQWQGKQVEVSFSRQFSAGKASTICLPFPMTSISGGKVYEFQDVTYNSSEGWVATMVDATPNMVTETVANTPYLFLPDDDGNVTFSGTIDNVPASVTAGTTESGDWTFHGTYSRLDYGTAPFSGTVFGFAATGGKANDGRTDVTAGQFIKAADGAFIQPFRAYLTYSGSNSALQAPSRRVQSDGIPDRITVRLIGNGGGTTAVGTIDTATGEVTIERWFNLNGQSVDGTPAAPGLYLNSDGRKVLISE